MKKLVTWIVSISCLFVSAGLYAQSNDIPGLTDEQLRKGAILMPVTDYGDEDPMEQTKKYQGLRVSDVVDALQAFGIQDITLMNKTIRPVWQDQTEALEHRVYGVAVTYQLLPTNRAQEGLKGDEEFRAWHSHWYKNYAPMLFKRILKPGHVVVIDAHDIENTGFIGSNNALQWKSLGMTGVITNGCCRDSDELMLQRIPVYAKYSGGGTRPGRIESGAVNIPVCVGGVLIRPGDIVVADGDGVVIVPRELSDKVAERAWKTAKSTKSGRAKLYDQMNMEHDATLK